MTLLCNQAELQDAVRGAVCARVRLAVDRHQVLPQLLPRQLVWLLMAWAAGAHVRVVHVEAPRVLAQHRQACLTKALDFQSGVPFWRRALALDAATLHCNGVRDRQHCDRDALQSERDVLGAKTATVPLDIDRNVEKLVQTVQTVYKPFHKPL